jgi:RHS repeat-associated protein
MEKELTDYKGGNGRLKVDGLANQKYSPHKTTRRNFGMVNIALRQRLFYRRKRNKFTGKELDPETGLYYYGARYLDPKTGRWLSGDPAMGEYFPSAPVSDEARKRNGNLPGQGGVFNYVNLHAYHYAGNNPVKYVDPDGEKFNSKQLIELLKSFADIFSVDFKVGVGFDLSVISSIKIDLFSSQTTISSKDGVKDKYTTGISVWIIGCSRTAPNIEFLSGIELLNSLGENEINIGPVIFNDKGNIDVVLSIGVQVVAGIRLNISGKEALNFLSKIGELQDALKQ